MRTEKRQITTDDGFEVGSVWAMPDNYAGHAVVLGHGAGAGMDHEFMSWFHEGIARNGALSVKFNFPYIERGRKAPDPRTRLEGAYRVVLRQVLAHPSRPKQVFIGGKSMGGRIASYLAAEEPGLSGLILLGYPLHPPGRPDRLRVSHWPEISSPCLFLQGTRDSLCDLDLLRDSLGSIAGEVHLHVVEGGNHSFHVLKKSGRTQQEVREEMLERIRSWIQEVSVIKAG